MTAEQLQEATEALVWLAMQVTKLPPDDDRARMGMSLELARSYLVEYQLHIARGVVPPEALALACKGTTDVTAVMTKHRQSLN